MNAQKVSNTLLWKNQDDRMVQINTKSMAHRDTEDDHKAVFQSHAYNTSRSLQQ